MSKRFLSRICIAFFLFLTSYFSLLAQVRDVSITIHLRGVNASDISIMGMTPSGTMKPFTDVKGVNNGTIASLMVPKDKLPGEFVVRFDYKEKPESTPYPSEKYIMINQQDLELWVNPLASNNPDSTWFQQGEKENAAFARFSKDNGQKKEKLGVLQQFLMNYDDPNSEFYRQGIKEYEMRRQAYNKWLDEQVATDKDLFVSSLYRFQFVPELLWKGTETERLLQMIAHYFDGIDLKDPLITKTTQLNDWMNAFVNLHGQMATTVALRDSLIPAAARSAIEKAKQGSPVVYGWMVDYFYRGFESNNIPIGMKVLQPYLDDPNCLTSKRMEIERRLKGMQSLVKGSKAPDFELKDVSGNNFRLYDYHPSTSRILLLFWSADCSHCAQTVDAIYPWLQKPENRNRISTVAISLDETDTEIAKWNQKVPVLPAWTHLRAAEGVRSKVASDYFILATPVMILLDSQSKEIISMPETPSDLMNL
ncbi:MAG: redoxin domain-containing protein [Bacteroidetes bacterium]|nr:redoxin domain-containing protein [Bacteroidota bacterium]